MSNIDDDSLHLLFPSLLGAAFNTLPVSVRKLHVARGLCIYRGHARVEFGRNLLSRLCAWVIRLPAAQDDAPIEVSIEKTLESEVWIRCFGNRRMRSRLVRASGLLRERLGVVIDSA